MEGDVLSIDRAQAEAGIRAISAINIMDVESNLMARQAFGETRLNGRGQGIQPQPAVQIYTELHLCLGNLSQEITEKFGTTHRMSDIWQGKTLGVQGVLIYADGGKLSCIKATGLREIPEAPAIDLNAVLDPDFTCGLDPYEYLEQLHEGKLG